MITVDFEGNSYLFTKTDDGGFWSGNGGSKGRRYPGRNLIAPSIIWPALFKAAIDSGVDESELICIKIEKKSSKPRAKKLKKNEISIF